MQKMKGFKLITLALSLILLIVACGQKGDLYLPDSKALISLFS